MKTKEPLIGVIRGYDAGVTALAFVSNSTICSGDDKGNLALWDVFTRRMIRDKICAHAGKDTKGGVLHLLLLRKEDNTAPILLSQGRDGTIKFWKISCSSANSSEDDAPSLMLHEAWTLDTTSKAFCKASVLHWHSHLLVSGTGFEPEVVKVWKISKNTGAKEEALSLHGGEKRGMCMQTRLYHFQDTHLVACLFESGHVQVASVATGEWTMESKVYGDVPVGLDFSVRVLDTKIKVKAVCCGSGDSVAAFTMNAERIKLVKTIPLSTGTLVKSGASCICVRQDQKIFATGGWDGKLRVFHWKKLELLAVLELHQQSVQSIAFSPDCSIMCSGSRDGHIALWSIYSPRNASAADFPGTSTA